MTIDQSLANITQNNLQDQDLFQNKLLNLLTEIIKQIRETQTEKDSLQTSVDLVRQVLQCDRVVVYSLHSESQGKIISEALTPGFLPTIGATIKDPCFEAQYTELYQKGRIKSIANIYEAGMSACYVESLEKIGVKANLVIPLISSDGNLFGLLVMHQCSEFRQWQQSEINFVIQVADWTMEQLEKLKKSYQLQDRLAQTNYWQNSLTQITEKLYQATKKSQVLQDTVEAVQEILNCDRVVVYGLAEQNSGRIVAEASLPALAPILGSVIKDPCFEYRYKDKYQQGRVRAINNIHQAGMSACYVENLEKIGVKANLVAPVNLPNGNLYGLLVAHQCFTYREWQAREIQWLKEVGIQIGANLLRTDLETQIQYLETSFDKLDTVKNSLNSARNKIAQIRQPLQNTMPLFLDINNLQSLLVREINGISNQKETKLMQIIVKKIALNLEKLKNSMSIFQGDSNQVEEILENVTSELAITESE